MSRVLEGQKRNFLFIVMLGVILILAVLLVWNLMGNKGETKTLLRVQRRHHLVLRRRLAGSPQVRRPLALQAVVIISVMCRWLLIRLLALSCRLIIGLRQQPMVLFTRYRLSMVLPISRGVVGYCFAHNPTGAGSGG